MKLLRGSLFLAVFAVVGAGAACGPQQVDVFDPASGDAILDTGKDGDTSSSTQDLNAGDVRLRLMGANISSGNYQSYDPGEGTRIFQGTHPDVVMIQEFNFGGNTAAELRSFVDTAFGPTFQYYREGGAQIPNGIISRYPILAAGEWDDPRVSNRDFAWARIDIPGSVDLYAISVHLLTASSSERNLEAQSLVSFIQQNVPAGAYVAIGGDFNTSSRTEACISTFSSVVSTAGPYPADRNGNSNTNAARAKPYDWVLVSSGLQAKKTSTDLGASVFTNGLVADTRVYSPISEISPARSTDSGAVNMQHMGIVRDFGITTGTTTAAVTVTAPNGGETYAAGSAQTITWTSSNVSTVRIEYSLDGGMSWTVLTSSTASTGSYGWTVPGSATSGGRVRVTDTVSGVTDSSNASFAIAVAPTPAVTVTSPNGGESWAGGSTHAITWSATAVSNVAIAYSLDYGSTWTTLTSSTAASTGSYSWTVPSSATTTAKVRVSDTAGAASDLSNAAFTITVSTGGSGVVYLNEVLVNEVGSDVNTEFVEIVNGTGAAMDLSGWTVSDSALVRHTFASGTTLADGAAIVVYGGASGVQAGTNGVAASTGALGLSNAGDSVFLKNAAGTTVDSVVLGSGLCSTDGVSANRSPDANPASGWALHTTVSSSLSSPGKKADGTAFGSTGGGGGTTTSITAESESNDSAATADGPVGNNKNVSASIGTSTDQDWFKVTVKTAGTITIKVSMPGTADLDWYLYPASNTTTYAARGYTTANPESGSYAAAAGDYYVKVVGYSGATSSYTLNVSAATGVIDP